MSQSGSLLGNGGGGGGTITSVTTTNATPQFVLAGTVENIDFNITNLALGTSMPARTTGIRNVIYGVSGSGQAITTGSTNTIIGDNCGKSLTSGQANVIIGSSAGLAMTTASNCVAVGHSALQNLITGPGVSHIAIGNSALGNLTAGTHNISIGESSGLSYGTIESSNILVGSAGANLESNTIRIGTAGSGTGQQNRNFQAGITGVTVAASAPTAVDTNGQLSSLGFGSATQVLTSNGAGVSPSWQAAGGAKPAFSAYLTTGGTNVTGDGTIYQVPYDTVISDTASAFTTGASALYTIPSTGNWQFQVGIDAFPDIGSGLQVVVGLFTTAHMVLINNVTLPASSIGTQFVVNGAITLPMTAGDTVYVTVQVAGGAKTCTVFGSSNIVTWFSGSQI